MGNEVKAAVTPMKVTPIDLLPAPLKALREQSKEQLHARLGALFDGADDALFELADKSSNNADQTMYFDSMREVRIKRRAMESIFVDTIQKSFRQLFQADDEQAAPAPVVKDIAGLSLVQDEELEESVAMQGMVARVKNHSGEQLKQLTARMDSLVHLKTIQDEANPLGPKSLCDALQQAAAELELDIRAKLVVYKLFERHVLDGTADMYAEANQFLAEQGVMPVESAAQGPGHRSIYNPDDEEDDNEILHFLQDLLANKRSDSGAGSVPAGSGAPAASGPSVSQGELISLLSALQQQAPTHHGNIAALNAQPIDVRGAITNLAQFEGQAHAPAFQQGDDDVINLVTLLFEFILDDRNLATPMKALLGRLQIPLLKVAVIDKRLFNRSGHPARKLLNELATAALGWSETADLEKDALYQKINQIVQRILDEFIDDVSLFEQLLVDFSEFIIKENHRAELIEQRTREAEEGAGKTQRSKAVVAYVLNDKAVGKRLPKVVIELLREGWSNYMFVTHLREGVEGEQWDDAVQVVDDLLWSVEVEPGSADSKKLLKLLPGLLNRLRKGLNAASIDKPTMRTWFTGLQRIHLASMRSDVAKPEPIVTDVPPDLKLGKIQTGENVVDETAKASQQEALAAEQKVAEVVELTETSQDSPLIIDDPSLTESVVEESEEIDEFAEMADSLRVGSWVELGEDGSERQRAKLAAIVRATGKYIFVNRIGMKVAERMRADLIEEMKTGLIAVLDNAHLFDRALESVISGLRE